MITKDNIATRIAEAEAEPEAARPDPVKYSNYFTGEGHAQIIKYSKILW